MPGEEDYYAVLGVGRDADPEAVRTAYRQCAKQYHPDLNRGDKAAEERFKKCAEAYEVLSDPEKRQRYDQYGKAGLRGAGMHDWAHADVNDIFSMFGDLFGGGFGASRGPARGASLRVVLSVTLEEVLHGVSKTVRVARQELCEKCRGSGSASGRRETCPTCAGHGRVEQGGGFFRIVTDCPRCRGTGSRVSDPCPECGGKRFVSRHRTIDIQVPAGIEDGQRIRYGGQGDAGEAGASAGDLYAEVQVEEHPFLERHGRDLLCQVPISLTQAALGAEVEVPTLEGKETLKVGRSTQSGDLYHLKGKGLPEINGYGRGDLLVQVFVEVPRKLSRHQEELLKELAKTEPKGTLPQRESYLEKLAEYVRRDKAEEKKKS
jgi:molecular chaperone DnaJ